MADQFDRLFGVGDIAAVDQRRLVAVEAQDVVGRQPAALQYQQGRGQAGSHSGASVLGLSLAGVSICGVTTSATMPGSPSGGRPQPRQKPESGSAMQIPTQM